MGVVEAEVTVRNKLGLHCRAAGHVAFTAREFNCDVRLRVCRAVTDGGRVEVYDVDAKSIVDVMVIALASGSQATIRADGEDAAEAVEAITKLFDSGFGEED